MIFQLALQLAIAGGMPGAWPAWGPAAPWGRIDGSAEVGASDPVPAPLSLTLPRAGAGADTLEGAVEALALRSTLGVRYASEAGGIATIELGAADAPRILVAPTSIVSSARFDAAWDPILRGGALGLAEQIATSAAWAKRLRDVTLVVLAEGPGVQKSSATAVDPTRNFPARWSQARAELGPVAGPYPASDPRVRSLVDWVERDPRLASIILLRAPSSSDDPPGLAATGHPSGSLQAFCAEQLGVSVHEVRVMARADSAGAPDQPRALAGARALAPVLDSELQSLPELRWADARWRRLGTGTWLLDVSLENIGRRSTGTDVHRVFRRERDIDVAVVLRERGWEWMACARRAESGGFAVLPVRGLAPELHRGGDRIATVEWRRWAALPDLDPRASHRLRFIITRSEPAAPSSVAAPDDSRAPNRDRPTVDLMARGARARGALLKAAGAAPEGASTGR